MTSHGVTFTDERLGIAADVLAEAGFNIERVESPQGREEIVADDSYFVVAVVDVLSLPEIGEAEAGLTDDLLRIASERDLGPRRWDLYSVILCESDVRPGDSVGILFELTYDTKYVRRIIRVGVKPTIASIREALRMFMPIRPMPMDAPLADPLADLEKALNEEGLAEDEAAHVIAAFRSHGGVENA